MLLESNPEKYQDVVIREGQDKVLCEHALKAPCGILMHKILCHNKFRKEIEAEAHQLNRLHGTHATQKSTRKKQDQR